MGIEPKTKGMKNSTFTPRTQNLIHLSRYVYLLIVYMKYIKKKKLDPQILEVQLNRAVCTPTRTALPNI